MKSLDELNLEIARLQAQLAPLKQARAILLRAEATSWVTGGRDTRFFNKRPKTAIREILSAYGKPMPQAELVQAAVDGGIAIGKKRGVFNVTVSIRTCVKNGSLTFDIKKELVGLAEWHKK
jgi:hypothetical protein